MTMFLWLMCAHFIGDFALQKEWIALNKGKYSYLMLAHCFIWSACVMAVLQYYGQDMLWKWNFLLVGHFVCDTWKCWSTKEFPTWHFYADQLFHFFQLSIVAHF